MGSALWCPKLSRWSQLYQPPRSAPICTSQGHTCDGGASIVTAIVALRVPPGMSSAVRYGLFTSSSVAPQRSMYGRSTARYPTVSRAISGTETHRSADFTGDSTPADHDLASAITVLLPPDPYSCTRPTDPAGSSRAR